jgi:hypothetical protein
MLGLTQARVAGLAGLKVGDIGIVARTKTAGEELSIAA